MKNLFIVLMLIVLSGCTLFPRQYVTTDIDYRTGYKQVSMVSGNWFTTSSVYTQYYQCLIQPHPPQGANLDLAYNQGRRCKKIGEIIK